VKLPNWFEKSRGPLYILLIFLCGVVSGALATRLWSGKDRQTQVAQADTTPTISRTQRLVERFTGELTLTPEQVEQLTVILDETRLRYQIKEDSTRAEGRNRIRQILTDEQRAKYEEIIAAADERRRLRRQQGQ
jgi:hypothetical protein